MVGTSWDRRRRGLFRAVLALTSCYPNRSRIDSEVRRCDSSVLSSVCWQARLVGTITSHARQIHPPSFRIMTLISRSDHSPRILDRLRLAVLIVGYDDQLAGLDICNGLVDGPNAIIPRAQRKICEGR